MANRRDPLVFAEPPLLKPNRTARDQQAAHLNGGLSSPFHWRKIRRGSEPGDPFCKGELPKPDHQKYARGAREVCETYFLSDVDSGPPAPLGGRTTGDPSPSARAARRAALISSTSPLATLSRTRPPGAAAA